MIFGIAPSDEDGARTDEERKSAHLSAKDIKWIAGGLVVFFAIMTPIYFEMRKRAYKHICIENFKEMNQAILAYAEQQDGRLPAVFTSYGGAPLIEKGAAITWIHSVSQYMSPQANFLCPSAEDSENANVLVASRAGQDGSTFSDAVAKSSYGMALSYSTIPLDSVAHPAQTVMITETSNRGARSTFNPLPLLTADGNLAPFDGPIIGWNDSNESWTPNTKSVTRLSFFGSQDGEFGPELEGRHRGGNHFLFLDGHFETLGPSAAVVRMAPSGPTGYWEAPPVLSQ